MTDDDVEYLRKPDPACPLCGRTTCGFARGEHCEGWQVELPEEPVFVLRDRIRAYWKHAAVAVALISVLLARLVVEALT